MPLTEFSCTDFRCLRAVELTPHPAFSLIVGPNASGKTSLLEAIGYLGRGRSFRGAATRDLVRHGAREFLLRGTVTSGDRRQRIGVRNGSDGLQQSIDGVRSGGLAELVAACPLQVIEPEVHELVAGGPEERRRFLDWMAFHVEPGFLAAWRRFRRALRQRNALLKSPAPSLDSWDEEVGQAGEALHEARRRLLETALPALSTVAERLIGGPVRFDYHRGWPEGTPLAEALRGAHDRDLQAASTQLGPQRADLKLRVDERLAKRLVSRGQQKLLACALVLGSVDVVSRVLGQPPLLLLDDPAAELDEGSLSRLMAAVADLGTQVIATALVVDSVAAPTDSALFHVERGALRPA